MGIGVLKPFILPLVLSLAFPPAMVIAMREVEGRAFANLAIGVCFWGFPAVIALLCFVRSFPLAAQVLSAKPRAVRNAPLVSFLPFTSRRTGLAIALGFGMISIMATTAMTSGLVAGMVAFALSDHARW